MEPVLPGAPDAGAGPGIPHPAAPRRSQAVAAVPVPTLPIPTPTVVCDVCPHPAEAHDPIGRRFCQATQAGAIVRGCICRIA